MCFLDIDTEDTGLLLSGLARYPTSKDIHSWTEDDRQEMITSPHTITFATPVLLTYYSTLSKVAYSLVGEDLALLGRAVEKGVTCQTKFRTTKSYNRQKKTKEEVEKIIDVILDPDHLSSPPDIAVTGNLVKSENGDGIITALVLVVGNIELALDLEWIARIFSSVSEFYRVNSSPAGKKTSGEKVYVLSWRKEGEEWILSVRNWRTPTPKSDGESHEDWKKKYKKENRDRNRFGVLDTEVTGERNATYSDEEGMTLICVVTAKS
jgi:hypothetical protein